MGKKQHYVVVNTTVASARDARRLAESIVKARLAACAQFFAIRSIYWWKNKVESAPEYLLLAKTRAATAGALTSYIRKNHSYEVPEILVTPLAGGHSPYLAWISAETAQAKPRRKKILIPRQ